MDFSDGASGEILDKEKIKMDHFWMDHFWIGYLVGFLVGIGVMLFINLGDSLRAIQRRNK